MADRSFDPGLAGNLVKYAEQLSRRGEYERALEASQEAIQVYEALWRIDPDAHQPQLARAFAAAASAYNGCGASPEALEYALRAEVLLSRPDSHAYKDDLLKIFDLIATLQIRLGRPRDALATAEKALALLPPAKRRRLPRPGRADFSLIRGQALSSLGQVAEAVAAVESALENSDEGDLPRLAGIGLQILSDAAEQLPEEATEAKADNARIREEILRRSAIAVSTADPDAEDEIGLYQRIAAETPDSALPALAGKLREHAWQLREQEDFVGALQVAQDAVEIARRLAELNHDNYSTHLAYALADHAALQQDMAVQAGEVDMLNSAADDLQEALRLLPAASGDRSHLLAELAGLRLRMADQTSEVRLLDLAIEGAYAASQSARDNDQARVSALVILGQAAWSRFQRTDDISTVTLAIESAREALAAMPPDDHFRGTVLGLLAEWLGARSEVTGDLRDLDESLDALRAGSTVISAEEQGRTWLLTTLGKVLLRRYSLTGNVTDLETSITSGRSALEGTAASDPQTRSMILGNLSQALVVRYERSGDAEDLEAAIHAGRQSLASSPDGDPNVLTKQFALATALYRSYQRTGERSALDEAIEVMRRAAARAATGSSNLSVILVNLSVMLRVRSGDSHATDDINESILAAQEAVRALAGDQDSLGPAVSNLCNALEVRYRQAGDPGDLDRAIEGWEGLAAWPSDQPANPAALVRLSDALRTRFSQSHTRHDINAAIDVARRASAALPADHPLRARAVGSLAEALFLRWNAGGMPPADDLGETILLARQAIGMAAKANPDLSARYMKLLGSALEARLAAGGDLIDQASLCLNTFEQTGSQDDLSSVIEAFLAATRAPDQILEDRIRAGYELGRFAMSHGRLDEALEGFRTAIDLLPRLLSDRIWHEKQLYDSESLTELISDAAACALQAEQPELALTLLEQGRMTVLTQALGSGRELDQLRLLHPGLANQVESLQTEMNQARDTAADTFRRRHLAGEFDRLITRIREIEGMEHFLSPPPVGSMHQAAANGPIAVINVSNYRCDALLLQADRIDVIALVDLDRKAAIERARNFQTALDQNYRPMSDALSHEEFLKETLSWLWDTVANPVLTALDPGPDLRRLWWIPTGPMTLFPLHAAGRTVNVLDQVVSSYSVTISALTEARAPASQASVSGTSLVIAPQPTIEGITRPLPGAAREARAVAGMLPAVRVLDGTQATLQRALSALPDAQILHFAGHGRYDSTAPGECTLLLSDGQLQFSRAISALKRSRPQLAFLSACSASHAPSPEMGEAVNLGMVMQLAGYRHSVSTLWEVNDRALADIAEDFYRLITREGLNVQESAATLHAVACRFRERFPHVPSLWAAHIHVGP